VGGREFLLEHEFERVGERLAEAPPGPLGHGEEAEDVDAAERNADAVRADAVLDGGADPALGHDGVGDEAEDDVDQDENLDERGRRRRAPSRERWRACRREKTDT
jgi:hypothetical protein